MRLLNTSTLEPQEFDYGNIPPYAILSHRWGKEEITLQELEQGVTTKEGFKKVRKCCKRAKRDGFDYAWIDTCCINKTSSAELSEAINSMYLWYYQADRCYAYLVDVPSKCMIEDSEWFTRGWTLQELLAPSEVHFVDEHWNDLGTRTELQGTISKCTGIPINILSGDDELESASIAQRMSWAAKRKTQRLEDRAYCLMGIFGINMPLLYGEGERAFIRLQQEIMRVSDDQSLFAWKSSDTRGGLLATSPEAFEGSKDIVPFNHFNDPGDPSTVSSRGIHLAVRFIGMGARGIGLAILQCTIRDGDKRPIAIYVKDQSWTMEDFERVRSDEWELLDLRNFISTQYPLRRLCIRVGRMTPIRRRDSIISQSDIVIRYHDCYGYKELDVLVNSADPGALWRAAERGSPDEVWLLLTRSDIEIFMQGEYAQTALKFAVDGGNETIAKILLVRGAQVNSPHRMSDTLLTSAMKQGHKGIIKLLLDHGATVNPPPGFGNGGAPLLFAVNEGREDIVELLLHRGAEIDLPPNEYSVTPLWAALENRHHGIARVLLENGAEVDEKSTIDNKTPLIYALEHGYDSSFIELLLDKGAGVESTNNRNETPLHLASGNGDVDAVKLLLDKGADIEAKSDTNLTPLSQAVLGERHDVVKLLLDHGADIETEPTPLALAASQGYAKLVKLLLRRGADIESRDSDGRTPLAVAAMSGEKSVAKLLLSEGAEIDCRDSQGRTPLALAAARAKESVVKLLLSQGADPHVRDFEGQTPLKIARKG
ncbi:ankyrin, partial [Trichoderma citrinoviride]